MRSTKVAFLQYTDCMFSAMNPKEISAIPITGEAMRKQREWAFLADGKAGAAAVQHRHEYDNLARRAREWRACMNDRESVASRQF
ncbi:hypothetical protein ACVWYQ_003262 [Bradyrhizobium sp. USDA 3397]